MGGATAGYAFRLPLKIALAKFSAGLNLDVRHEEIDLSVSTFKWPDNGLYLSGLEVYHSLHCLVCNLSAIYL